jgi:hypothetical protein
MKKRNCFHFLEYQRIKLWRKTRKTIKKLLLVVWEIIYYGAIYLFGITKVYESYQEPQVPIWLLSLALLIILINHKTMKSNYKDWQKQAEYNNFYKRFLWAYKLPQLLPQLILIFCFAKYCSTGSFIILSGFLLYADMEDRRYYTNDIKQDMILKKLER